MPSFSWEKMLSHRAWAPTGNALLVRMASRSASRNDTGSAITESCIIRTLPPSTSNVTGICSGRRNLSLPFFALCHVQHIELLFLDQAIDCILCMFVLEHIHCDHDRFRMPGLKIL